MLGSAATLSAIILYMASSAGMTIVNKLAVRALPLPLLVTVVQMLFTVLCLVAVPALRKAVHFGSARDAWRWGRAIPPLFAMMLATSMLALRHASMGAVVVVRSIAPLPTLAVEALCGEKVRVDAATVLSLLLGVAGVLLYSRHDIQFSSAGLCWLGANTLAAVLERLLQRHMIAVEPIDVSKQGMMLINNGVGALLVLPIALATGEGSKLLQPPDAGESTGGASSGGAIVLDAHAAVLLLLSCINGMVISYAGLNVQAHVTATAMLVLNNSCKFVVVAFGVFVLNEASSPQSVVGCTAALGAGLLYAHARQQLSTRTAAATAAAAAAEAEAAEQGAGAPPPPEGKEEATSATMKARDHPRWKLGLQAVAVAALFAVALRPAEAGAATPAAATLAAGTPASATTLLPPVEASAGGQPQPATVPPSAHNNHGGALSPKPAAKKSAAVKPAVKPATQPIAKPAAAAPAAEHLTDHHAAHAAHAAHNHSVPRLGAHNHSTLHESSAAPALHAAKPHGATSGHSDLLAPSAAKAAAARAEVLKSAPQATAAPSSAHHHAHGNATVAKPSMASTHHAHASATAANSAAQEKKRIRRRK